MHAIKHEGLKCIQPSMRCQNACNQARGIGIHAIKHEVLGCMQPRGH